MSTSPSRWTRRHLIATGAGVAASAMLTRTVAGQEASPASGTPNETVTYPVTVTHDAGKTTLEQEPQRIAALEWSIVEDLLVLGIQPVAIADIEGYKTWVTIEAELAADVQDVGVRWEPSLEALAAAEPDLILGLDYRDGAIYDQLAKIAPTILVSAYPEDEGETPLADLVDRLRMQGAFLNRVAEADAAIEQMNATIEEKNAQIKAEGLTDAPYIVVQGGTYENTPEWRIFTDGALVGAAISATGLKNVWTADGGDWGFTTNNIETFVELPEDVNVFYIVNGEDDILEKFLNDDPIWQSLPFVQEERFFPLGGDTWTFGGTQSVQRIVTRSTEQITGSATQS